MIGDNIQLKDEYLKTANEVLNLLQRDSLPAKFVVGISGESGSGKSTLALALAHILKEQHVSPILIHMDDYFVLPPQHTHFKRVEDLGNVGKHEVRLDLLQAHIDTFIKGEIGIEKPLINFKENSIGKEYLSFQHHPLLILEGTYVCFLENIHVKVHLTRDYNMTKSDRHKRGRDQNDPIIEKVLAIEHEIIKQQIAWCDILITPDFKVKINEIK